MAKIVIVDDDQASCRTLQLHLQSQGSKIFMAHSVADGLTCISDNHPDLLILDIRMPGESGLEGLPRFKEIMPDLDIIMITAFHDMESTIEAMQKGATDYIHKPIDIDELDAAIKKSLDNKKSKDDFTFIGTGPDNRLSMIGHSRAMKDIFKTIGQVAQSPAMVLITGESGTGKELVAQAIHRASHNGSAPFIAINCAAVVETLLESEMFGHEKGAFTGATSRQQGKFAQADGGTIFLDEIGDMSTMMQAKLLRILQEKEYTPVGGKNAIKTTARIIAATNADLKEKVKDGTFREDLFYRLQVVNIHIPPLRERKEDIPVLAQALLKRVNQDIGRQVTQVSRNAMQAFQKYPWPGNVRELENTLMKMVAITSTDTIHSDLLPDSIRQCVPSKITPSSPEETVEKLSLADVEKKHVERILHHTNWHKGETCEILGVSRPRLRRLIEHYGLKPEQPSQLSEED
jgi:DNA-binding NtrC family response regulator